MTLSESSSKPSVEQQVPVLQLQKRQNVRSSSFKPLTRSLSLRAKLLIGFSLVFSIVFAGTFFWFYRFTTEKSLLQLKERMEHTLEGAIAGVDVDDLEDLYEEGTPNAAGFSDDPRYLEQLQWFDTIYSVEPRVWLYTYVLEDLGPSGMTDDRGNEIRRMQIIYLVDLWAKHDPSKAARFLEEFAPAGDGPRQAIKQERMIVSADIYTDSWGSWMSAFAPLYNSDGEVVAGIGLDIEADYVFEVQQVIRNRVLLSFSITYGILFILIYILSGVLTHQLTELASSAERIGAGNYSLPLPLSRKELFPDELDQLTEVFQNMVESIRTREKIIRESKRIEDEIRHALQEEKEINELKSRFVSMVSHELRTPLTIVRTSAELLEKYGHVATDEKKKEYYNRIRAAVSNMTQMLEDVLTFEKGEAGKLELKPTIVNLGRFSTEIVEEMRLGVGIGYDIVADIDLSEKDAYVDPALMRSILTNLLSNAIKYSSKGSRVEFSLTYEEEDVVLIIQDHGIGIPRDDQPRLFELFHRASNTNTIRGTGIGLAIVKQCVALHNGQVRFKSEEGKGTTFIVRIPLPPVPTIPEKKEKDLD